MRNYYLYIVVVHIASGIIFDHWTNLGHGPPVYHIEIKILQVKGKLAYIRHLYGLYTLALGLDHHGSTRGGDILSTFFPELNWSPVAGSGRVE